MAVLLHWTFLDNSSYTPSHYCVIQRTRTSKPMVVHFDKLKPVVGITPVSWLSTGSGGTPVIVGGENVEHGIYRPKRPIDVVANGTAGLNVANSHSRTLAIMSRTNGRFSSRNGVERETVDQSTHFDIYNVSPFASRQGSRPKKISHEPMVS